MASRFLPLRRSARFTLWAAGGAAALSAAAALTLDGGWASLALLGAGAFVACALYAVLGMSRLPWQPSPAADPRWPSGQHWLS